MKTELLAVGDIMLAGRVGKTLEEHGIPFVFANIRNALFSSADLIFGNLEMPFSEERIPLFAGVDQSYWVAPEHIEVLKYLDFDVLNLASNHILDWGPGAISLTKKLFRANGIRSVGAGKNEREARTPVILNRHGSKIGVLGYCKHGLYTAKNKSPGAVAIREAAIKQDVQKIRSEVDFLLVSLHWGLELSDYPYPESVEFAHKLIELGVDAIIGHHPHVIQGIEEYHGRPIAYSLGNFIFDNYAGPTVSKQAWEKQHEGIVLKIVLKKGSVAEWQAIPVQLSDIGVNLAEGLTKERIEERLHFLSSIIQNGKTKEYFYDFGVDNIFKRELEVHVALLKKEGVKFILERIRTLKFRHLKLVGNHFWARFIRKSSGISQSPDDAAAHVRPDAEQGSHVHKSKERILD